MPFRLSQPRYVIQIRRFVTRVRSSSLGNTRQRLKTSVYKYGTATNLIDLEDTRQRRKHAELYPLCVFPIPDVVWKWGGQVGFGVVKARDRLGIRLISFRIRIKCLLLCSRADVVYLGKFIWFIVGNVVFFCHFSFVGPDIQESNVVLRALAVPRPHANIKVIKSIFRTYNKWLSRSKPWARSALLYHLLSHTIA